MFKVDVRTALDLLSPRFNIKRGRSGKTWPITGNWMQFNSQLTPKHVDRLLSRIIQRHDRSGRSSFVAWIDTAGLHSRGKLWYLQRILRCATLQYLLKRGWDWNTKFKRWELPIYVYFGDKVIVWNGTHRTILSILAGRRLRARVIDLNDFLAWAKKNPDESKWNVRRVVKVRGKRRG